MNFQISGLRRDQFAPLFGLSDEELKRLGAMRVLAEPTATSRFPCRISLRDASPGDPVLLVNFEHLPVASPYRSRYAVFVCENALEAQLEVNEIPEVMLHRPLSLRAFDGDGMLIDADLAQDGTLAPTIERLLGQARAQFVDAHNARHGCYVARIARA